MTSSRFSLPIVAALLGLAGLPGVAFAQARSSSDIESARRAYNEGFALREKGDLKGALEKFKAAHALGNTPITGAELCKVHAALGQPVEAREACLGVARIPVASAESPNAQAARVDAARLAEELKSRISVVRLRLTGVPQGREPTVTVDGSPIPTAALAEPRALDAGSHVVTAKVGKSPETRVVFETKEGETRDVDLAVAAASEPEPVAPPPEPAPSTPHKSSSPLATAAFVFAGVTAGVGIIGGVAALNGKSEVESKCANKICGRDDFDTLDHAKTWGNVATGMFIASGVGLAVGLISLATSSKSSAPSSRRLVVPVIGLGGAGIHGTF